MHFVTRADGACIYLRSFDKSGNILSRLLGAKSKVAPIKQLTLPRLELCETVLLIHLVTKCLYFIKLNLDKYYFRTDATITLSRIKGSPTRWKRFVANPVSGIQRLTSVQDWYHVSSTDNPVDLISRGMNVVNIAGWSLWWTGPPWLSSKNGHFNKISSNNLGIIPEKRTVGV